MKQMNTARVSRGLVGLLLTVVLLTLIAVPAMADTTGVIRNPNGGSYVNVRSWPSYDADILSRLGVGTTVQITGSTGTWYSVWVNGVIGYIHANFVSTSGNGGGNVGTTASVRNGPLNVREAPSMRARVITQLPTGFRVTVLSDEGTWTQIQTGQTLGYVVSSYLVYDNWNPAPNPTPAPRPPVVTPDANATIRTANGGNLNMRSYASSSAPIVGSYGNGSRVRVLTQGSNWCRVQAGNDYGYMSTQFLVMDGGGVIPGPNPGAGYDAVINNPGAGQLLNLREQPNTTSRSLAQFQNGAYVKVLGVGTEWCRVNAGGLTGYMMSKYLRIVTAGATPHKTVTGGAGGYVNLRSGAGHNFNVLMRVSNGTAASVVVPYPTWSEVLVRQGAGYVRGYMENTFLK